MFGKQAATARHVSVRAGRADTWASTRTVVDSRRPQVHPRASDSATTVRVRSSHYAKAVRRLDGKHLSNLFDVQLVRAKPPRLHEGSAKQRVDGERKLRFKGVRSDRKTRQLREGSEQHLERGRRVSRRQTWRTLGSADDAAPSHARSWLAQPSGCTAATGSVQGAAPVAAAQTGKLARAAGRA